jgi:hypothetical protein
MTIDPEVFFSYAVPKAKVVYETTCRKIGHEGVVVVCGDLRHDLLREVAISLSGKEAVEERIRMTAKGKTPPFLCGLDKEFFDDLEGVKHVILPDTIVVIVITDEMVHVRAIPKNG